MDDKLLTKTVKFMSLENLYIYDTSFVNPSGHQCYPPTDINNLINIII